MMQLLMEHLRECGYSQCYLWTMREQETVAVLYNRFGFTLIEEKVSTAKKSHRKNSDMIQCCKSLR